MHEHGKILHGRPMALGVLKMAEGHGPGQRMSFAAEPSPRITARQEVDQRVRRYMDTHPALNYGEAASMVLAADPALKKAYSMDRGAAPRPSNGNNAGAELDRLTKERMAKTGEKNYGAAMKAVLQSNPDLKKRYARSGK